MHRREGLTARVGREGSRHRLLQESVLLPQESELLTRVPGRPRLLLITGQQVQLTVTSLFLAPKADVPRGLWRGHTPSRSVVLPGD